MAWLRSWSIRDDAVVGVWNGSAAWDRRMSCPRRPPTGTVRWARSPCAGRRKSLSVRGLLAHSLPDEVAGFGLKDAGLWCAPARPELWVDRCRPRSRGALAQLKRQLAPGATRQVVFWVRSPFSYGSLPKGVVGAQSERTVPFVPCSAALSPVGHHSSHQIMMLVENEGCWGYYFILVVRTMDRLKFQCLLYTFLHHRGEKPIYNIHCVDETTSNSKTRVFSCTFCRPCLQLSNSVHVLGIQWRKKQSA